MAQNGAGDINQLDCSTMFPAFAFSARKCFQSGSCIIFARFCLAIGRVLVDASMHERIELAAFTDEVIMRLTHMAELHRIGELAVEVELAGTLPGNTR